jgi:hypothetical protein
MAFQKVPHIGIASQIRSNIDMNSGQSSALWSKPRGRSFIFSQVATNFEAVNGKLIDTLRFG